MDTDETHQDAAPEYPKMDECRICGRDFMAQQSVDYCSTSCANEKYAPYGGGK